MSHLGAESPVNPREGFYNPDDYKSDSSEEEDDDDDEDAEGQSFDEKPLDSVTESAKAAKLSSDLADTEALEKAKALILAAESKATSPDKKRTKSYKKTKLPKTPGDESTDDDDNDDVSTLPDQNVYVHNTNSTCSTQIPCDRRHQKFQRLY